MKPTPVGAAGSQGTASCCASSSPWESWSFSLPTPSHWQAWDHPALGCQVRNSESNRTLYIFTAVQQKAVGHRCFCNCDMLGTFPRLQAQRVWASFFHLGASVGEPHSSGALMGTRWQPVPALAEPGKSHVPVPIHCFLPPIPSWGASFGDGHLPCSLQSGVLLGFLPGRRMESHVCCCVKPVNPSSCFLRNDKKRTREQL